MSVEFIDYYAVLGVDEEDVDVYALNAREIRRAYRQRAKKVHPDHNKSPDAEKEFAALYAAFEVLSDDAERAKFDALRRRKDQQKELSKERNARRKEAIDALARREAQAAQMRAYRAGDAASAKRQRELQRERLRAELDRFRAEFREEEQLRTLAAQHVAARHQRSRDEREKWTPAQRAFLEVRPSTTPFNRYQSDTLRRLQGMPAPPSES
ncbi:MAG: hypothetical protein MHM6MM_000680 [Cercozoa sp. M6MM]